MFEDSPIKKILFDKLVEMGRLPSNPSESTIQTINDISDSEALQLLRSVGVGPTISKAGGGMMNIDEMIRPIGMAAGGPIPPEDNVLEKLKKNDPDKELRDKGILPPLREKEGGTLLSSGMHPLVVFKEMYDQYRIDGGEMSFKEFFDMIQIELNKEASS
jgi:hypothetical protein